MINIEANLADMQKHFSFNLMEVEQGSLEWKTMRLGVMSASNADKIVSKGDKRRTYMNSLLAQIATKAVDDDIPSAPLLWGKDNEPAARAAYEFEIGSTVNEIPFVFACNGRAGASPDGLIFDKNMGFECKCPWNTGIFLDFVCHGKIKPAYQWQVQFCLFVTGLNQWVFANYDPRVKTKMLHSVIIERDDKKQATIRDAVNQMALDMDEALEKIGLKWGDQWKN